MYIYIYILPIYTYVDIYIHKCVCMPRNIFHKCIYIHMSRLLYINVCIHSWTIYIYMLFASNPNPKLLNFIRPRTPVDSVLDCGFIEFLDVLLTQQMSFQSMFVYIYIYIETIYVYIYINKYIYTYIWYTYIYVYTCGIYTHVYLYIYIYIYRCLNI